MGYVKQIVDGQQQCSTCKEWKPVDQFAPHKLTHNKIETRCRHCEVKRRQAWANRSVETAMTLLYRSHKQLVKFRTPSDRRKRLVESSSITPALLLELWHSQQGRCDVTGVPMTYCRGLGTRVFTNASIDRIDSDFGYTPDNVRLVCKAVNWMKHEMTDREMLQWAALILNGPLTKTRT